MVINNEPELLNKITDEILNPLNEKKSLKQICEELQLEDTAILYDEVLEAMDKAYEFYTIKENAFIPIPDVWMEFVSTMNKLQPRLF